MLLVYSPNSPYARKVRILLREKKLQCESVIQMPFAADNKLPDYNPLGKVPALVTDAGVKLFDSRVIAEYLDGIAPSPRFIPADFDERIEVRRWEALADGVADAAAQIVYENRRADPVKRSADWIARQSGKIEAGLVQMATDLGTGASCTRSGYNLADVAVGCVLFFLELAGNFPIPDFAARKRYPNLARLMDQLAMRPSFQATVPPGQ